MKEKNLDYYLEMITKGEMKNPVSDKDKGYNASASKATSADFERGKTDPATMRSPQERGMNNSASKTTSASFDKKGGHDWKDKKSEEEKGLNNSKSKQDRVK
jgi:hypothetical protein